MPITRRQFELGIDENIQRWMESTYAFLQDRRDVAFTREELNKTLSSASEPTTARDDNLGHALDALVRVGAAESRFVGPDLYYSFGDDINMETWERPPVQV